ncbi:NUDIX hydrolase [Fictibacillus barbaricus]|uniref:ADP-ribose pyrophosphatase YjhB (NUDIX family) n=1 Tax=Fictibacillus barbaricus TaxID=182136 RepID=A0ABU1TWI6_9BACL|nr:NUDIX hydrolase [Fictibacillus barbaricus]MDR7071575.1 ADP-ribose pyrophosphatase YjhB (NUDIX family) [Fictibacillus barbaricus]
MLSQGVVIQNNQLLMVKQRVKRGDTVWNFPGGGVEKDETFEEACIREVREETGYAERIIELLYTNDSKHTYLCEVVSGELTIEDDEDILDVQWVGLFDDHYFDDVSKPIVELVRKLTMQERGKRYV